MVQPADHDLFEGSKMTFGEHLDELRSALLKALLSLIVGFLIGLFFGKDIVTFLQVPMVKALEQYYANQSAPKYVKMLEERIARDQSMPPELEGFGELSSEDKIEAVKDLLDKKQMLPEEVYVDPVELFGELKKSAPEMVEGIKPPSTDSEQMVRLFIWRRLGEDDRTKLKSLSGPEPFLVYIKASLLFGFVAGSPLIFYFMWNFVGTGLYPHEKKYVHVFLPFSLLLFLAGAALAFFAVFRYVLRFLFLFNSAMGIDPDPRINEWLSFALMLPLGFGISFQLPLVMLFLERIGIFSVAIYLEKWRVAVLVIAVLSMLLTPSDPQSMVLMTIPLTGLYFFGVLLCRFMPRRKTPLG